MEITTILIVALSILILMTLIVFALELFIPIQMKFEMNGICRSYIFEIESEGELSEHNRDKLLESLEKIQLMDVSIVIEAEGLKYGDLTKVVIQGKYHHNSMVKLFKRSNDTLIMRFERRLYVRKIIN